MTIIQARILATSAAIAVLIGPPVILLVILQSLRRRLLAEPTDALQSALYGIWFLLAATPLPIAAVLSHWLPRGNLGSFTFVFEPLLSLGFCITGIIILLRNTNSWTRFVGALAGIMTSIVSVLLFLAGMVSA
jgi:hypothetical protein